MPSVLSSARIRDKVEAGVVARPLMAASHPNQPEPVSCRAGKLPAREAKLSTPPSPAMNSRRLICLRPV
jgi:hypothetical protein